MMCSIVEKMTIYVVVLLLFTVQTFIVAQDTLVKDRSELDALWEDYKVRFQILSFVL